MLRRRNLWLHLSKTQNAKRKTQKAKGKKTKLTKQNAKRKRRRHGRKPRRCETKRCLFIEKKERERNASKKELVA